MFELLAALLPCAWGYCQVAQKLAAAGVPRISATPLEPVRMNVLGDVPGG